MERASEDGMDMAGATARAEAATRTNTTGAETGETRAISGAALVLILAAAFMVVLDFSIVNVALPSVQHELGFSASAVQWIVTAYAITFGGLLILGGRTADLFGRRRTFAAGLLIFTAASLSGGLAHDQLLLIASRAVQGIGGALVAPAALSLITTGFPAGPRRNRALGMYGATASIGFVAGQVLGGVLVEFTSWRAVFLVNVPLGIAAVLLAPRLLGKSEPRRGARRMDVGGGVLITLAVAALVYAVSQVGVLGLADPRVIGALLVSAGAAAGLYALERRHPEPLIRTDLLRQPGLSKAGWMNVLLGLWNGGEMIVLSLYLQQVLHESPLATGLAIAPQGVIGFTAGVSGAALARRLGVGRVLVLTSSLAAVGFLLLTRLPAGGGYSPLFLAVMLVGFGTAGTAFGTMVTASQGGEDDEQGLIGGVLNTGRQVGAAIGAALLPAISQAADRGPVAGVTGDRDAMLVAAAAAGLAVLVAWRSEHRPAHKSRPVATEPAAPTRH